MMSFERAMLNAVIRTAGDVSRTLRRREAKRQSERAKLAAMTPFELSRIVLDDAAPPAQFRTVVKWAKLETTQRANIDALAVLLNDGLDSAASPARVRKARNRIVRAWQSTH